MNSETFGFLLNATYWDPANPDGFPARTLEHLHYSALALAIAFLLAFPTGLLIGHTNRGSFLAINAGNVGRALPTLGVVMLVVSLAGLGLVPITIALAVLAIPPILTTTYAGIRAVSTATVDAARGVGMKEWQIVVEVEVPNALPIIFGGLRNATLQVVSTATIAAYLGLGGLGRYLFDGLALRDYPRVVAGAVVLAVMAVAVDLLLGGVQRLVVSPGVDGRVSRGSRPARTAVVNGRVPHQRRSRLSSGTAPDPIRKLPSTQQHVPDREE